MHFHFSSGVDSEVRQWTDDQKISYTYAVTQSQVQLASTVTVAV